MRGFWCEWIAYSSHRQEQPIEPQQWHMRISRSSPASCPGPNPWRRSLSHRLWTWTPMRDLLNGWKHVSITDKNIFVLESILSCMRSSWQQHVSLRHTESSTSHSLATSPQEIAKNRHIDSWTSQPLCTFLVCSFFFCTKTRLSLKLHINYECPSLFSPDNNMFTPSSCLAPTKKGRTSMSHHFASWEVTECFWQKFMSTQHRINIH